MMARVILFGLLAVVAAAAAVLSFAALRDLGLACGFGQLSALVPVVIDAGACAGSVSWLTSPPGAAQVFGRRLALVLLGSSVVGNGIAHLLEAEGWAVAWWLVVAVAALAPCVLGAVVHLVVVAVQSTTERPEVVEGEAGTGTRPVSTPADHAFSQRREELGDATEKGSALARTPDAGQQLPAIPEARFPASGSVAGDGPALGSSPVQVADQAQVDQVSETGHLGQDERPTGSDVGQGPTGDRAEELLATGAGRVVLARELSISTTEARRLAASRRNGHGSVR